MKKIFISAVLGIFMVSTFAVGDIPFFKSLFMGDEEYIKQKILKFKDLEIIFKEGD